MAHRWYSGKLMFVSLVSTAVLFLCLVLPLHEACFIRNCPLGGKRSSGSLPMSTWSKKHKCMSCGPGDQGQCVSTRICCGLSIGCYMDTQETAVCMAENQSPVPCEVDGPTCREHGHCVAEDICCTDEKCTLDSTCSSQYMSAMDDMVSRHGYSDEDLISRFNAEELGDIMKHLLKSRPFGGK